MHADDKDRLAQLRHALQDLRHDGGLPGLTTDDHVDSLARNLIQSLRRERYPRRLLQLNPGLQRADPTSSRFDPLRGAIALNSAGQHDDAMWLLFLATHFGESPTSGWGLLRFVYGMGLARTTLTWDFATNRFPDFLEWHRSSIPSIRGAGSFGNHRKRESHESTPRVVETYIDFIDGRPHALAIAPPPPVGGSPGERFEGAYRAMEPVHRFGRLGRFDYLSMAGKLDLADVRPGHAYLAGSSGPLSGARMLFAPADEQIDVDTASDRASELATQLGVGFSPLEDALCNWQKHPDQFRPFRG